MKLPSIRNTLFVHLQQYSAGNDTSISAMNEVVNELAQKLRKHKLTSTYLETRFYVILLYEIDTNTLQIVA